MRVENRHERRLPADATTLGGLVDTIADPEHTIWPRTWPGLRFDRPLAVGARGGHGPIRYHVEAYEPGRSVTCRFTAPAGMLGTHTLSREGDRLCHVIAMDTTGSARLLWPLVLRPLHDALLEDLLDNAERRVAGSVAAPQRWSRRVRLLRRLLGGRQRPR